MSTGSIKGDDTRDMLKGLTVAISTNPTISQASFTPKTSPWTEKTLESVPFFTQEPQSNQIGLDKQYFPSALVHQFGMQSAEDFLAFINLPEGKATKTLFAKAMEEMVERKEQPPFETQEAQKREASFQTTFLALIASFYLEKKAQANAVNEVPQQTQQEARLAKDESPTTQTSLEEDQVAHWQTQQAEDNEAIAAITGKYSSLEEKITQQQASLIAVAQQKAELEREHQSIRDFLADKNEPYMPKPNMSADEALSLILQMQKTQAAIQKQIKNNNESLSSLAESDPEQLQNNTQISENSLLQEQLEELSLFHEIALSNLTPQQIDDYINSHKTHLSEENIAVLGQLKDNDTAGTYFIDANGQQTSDYEKAYFVIANNKTVVLIDGEYHLADKQEVKDGKFLDTVSKDNRSKAKQAAKNRPNITLKYDHQRRMANLSEKINQHDAGLSKQQSRLTQLNNARQEIFNRINARQVLIELSNSPSLLLTTTPKPGSSRQQKATSANTINTKTILADANDRRYQNVATMLNNITVESFNDPQNYDNYAIVSTQLPSLLQNAGPEIKIQIMKRLEALDGQFADSPVTAQSKGYAGRLEAEEAQSSLGHNIGPKTPQEVAQEQRSPFIDEMMRPSPHLNKPNPDK